MATTNPEAKPALAPAPYNSIARRIGLRMRDMYEHPEGARLPDEHVDLLLRLRQKERERSRSRL